MTSKSEVEGGSLLNEASRPAISLWRGAAALVAGLFGSPLLTGIAVLALVMLVATVAGSPRSTTTLIAVICAGAVGTAACCMVGVVLGRQRQIPWTFAAGAGLAPFMNLTQLLLRWAWYSGHEVFEGRSAYVAAIASIAGGVGLVVGFWLGRRSC